MILLDNWLTVPLVILLNTLGLRRRTQLIACLLLGSVVLPALPILLDLQGEMALDVPFIRVASAFNNVVVLLLLALVVEFLWRRAKWAVGALAVIVALLLGRTAEGFLFFSLTLVALVGVVDRWRLTPPFRSTVASR